MIRVKLTNKTKYSTTVLRKIILRAKRQVEKTEGQIEHWKYWRILILPSQGLAFHKVTSMVGEIECGPSLDEKSFARACEPLFILMAWPNRKSILRTWRGHEITYASAVEIPKREAKPAKPRPQKSIQRKRYERVLSNIEASERRIVKYERLLRANQRRLQELQKKRRYYEKEFERIRNAKLSSLSDQQFADRMKARRDEVAPTNRDSR